MSQAWTQLAGILPTLGASLVESVEALTVVLALGAARGRSGAGRHSSRAAFTKG